MAPVILTVTTPVQVGHQVVVTGAGFGDVSSCAIVNADTAEVVDCPDFIVDTGNSIHLTVPRQTPAGLYQILLGTLFGEHGDSGELLTDVMLGPIPWPEEPVFPPGGTTIEAVRERVRYELGDYTATFSASILGDGNQVRFDLPVGAVIGAPTLTITDGATTTVLTTGDYTIDARRGVVTLPTPLPAGATLRAEGTHAQFYTDAELDMFIQSALYKHTHNATQRIVTRSPVTGRMRYETDVQDITNLPVVEIHPLAILATIEALWALAADASYDIDVTTAEGTSLPRQERYRAIMQMIAAQQERYNEYSRTLNIGMSRMEMFTLRRVSRTTGRYVPIYQDREYDDMTPPTRIFPPVDRGVTGSGTTKRVPVGQQYPPGQ